MRFSLDSGFNEDQFRWCFISEDDADAMGAAAAGADYGGSMGSTDSGSDRGGSNDNDNDNDATWDSVVNDPDWATTPSVSSFADQGQAAATFNYGFGSTATPTQAEAAANFNYGFGTPTQTSPVSNVRMVNGVPVERRSPVSVDIANYQPTNYGQADLDKALAEFGDARDAAYADKQFGADFGMFKGPFGMYEGIYDAIFDPEAALANALAEKGARTYNGEAIPSSYANFSQRGLDLATAGGPLSEGGRVAGYDEFGNVVYDTSPFSGLNPFGEGVPKNIQELYDRQRMVDEQQRAMNGGDSQSLLIPEIAETDPETGEPTAFPTHTPRQYKYQPYVGKFYSVPSRFTKPYGLLG